MSLAFFRSVGFKPYVTEKQTNVRLADGIKLNNYPASFLQNIKNNKPLKLLIHDSVTTDNTKRFTKIIQKRLIFIISSTYLAESEIYFLFLSCARTKCTCARWTCAHYKPFCAAHKSIWRTHEAIWRTPETIWRTPAHTCVRTNPFGALTKGFGALTETFGALTEIFGALTEIFGAIMEIFRAVKLNISLQACLFYRLLYLFAYFV